ncbi:MAG: hypothetical protein Q4C34_04585 [Bacteroidales bacterium]|nr:hypothetical protein [Bacteroidales bacterium]
MKIDKYTLVYRIFIVTFWVMWCWGFVSEQLIPPLDKLDSYELVLVDGVLIALGIATLRNRGDMLVLGSFIIIAVASTILVNKLSMFDLLNGSRDFIGVLFMVPIVRWFLTSEHSDDFIKKFDKQLLAWMYVQAFCATWQFIRYGANDEVGGSLGNKATGILSISLFMVSFYFLCKNWDSSNYMKSLRRNIKYIILLYPTMLNETKASFIFILLYFVLLIRVDRTLVMRLFMIIPVVIGIMSVLFVVYLDLTNQEADRILSSDFLEMYLVSGDVDLDHTVEMAEMYQDGVFDDALEVEWWTLDVPRFAKMILILPIMQREPGDIWLGAGLGHLKNGKHAEQTRFAKEYNWVLTGTVTWLMFMFVCFGIVGVLWFFGVFAWQMFGGGPVVDTNGKRVLAFMILTMLFIVIYNDSFRLPAQYLFFAYFGLLIHRKGVFAERPVNPCLEPSVSAGAKNS